MNVHRTYENLFYLFDCINLIVFSTMPSIMAHYKSGKFRRWLEVRRQAGGAWEYRCKLCFERPLLAGVDPSGTTGVCA